MVILNAKLWPKITDELQTFANDWVNNCVFYFKCLLLIHCVNVNSILFERRIVKNYQVKNISSHCCKDVLESHF